MFINCFAIDIGNADEPLRAVSHVGCPDEFVEPINHIWNIGTIARRARRGNGTARLTSDVKETVNIYFDLSRGAKHCDVRVCVFVGSHISTINDQLTNSRDALNHGKWQNLKTIM